MMLSDGRLRALVCGLLIAASVLFAIGVAIERHDTRGERAARHAQAPAVILLADSDQGTGERPPGSRHEAAGESGAQLTRERSSERVFGINPESIPLVAAVLAASFALALVLWLRPSPLIVPPIIILGLGAAAFDIREVLHQLDESRANLAVIASIVAVLHVAAAITAAILARRLTRRANAATATASG